ncbi:MarR family transcriptional regulator [Verrucomicrobium sp. BvORR034]|uniref:MarR family winged helix-turn-helix transcriptional regulator n=1 Tax=Verrucomicrobium sp. BvORR034 TaxID=1396418 RepID=UPI0006792CDA|nr:MarR family transcriptional regulator [Verrucomicrobium sp. BvORR034]
MAASKLTKREYETLAAFRFSLRQFLRFSEEAAKSEGITPQQHQALLALKGFPGRECAKIGELAERLQVQHHSAVGLVDRLEADGMVTREPSAEDRRQVFIHLTPRGEELLEKLASVHREQLRRIGPELRQILGYLSDHKEPPLKLP